ncbi:MAG TPA: diguanylate cyclase [Longimicrobiales bacterium]
MNSPFCHFAFPPETAPLAIPAPALHVVFGGSVLGAMLVAGVVAYRFRLEIDRAEAALTRSNEELARLSGLDPLTGLANRRTLDECLARECARLRRPGQQIAVLLCDVDHFKAYNDHYGTWRAMPASSAWPMCSSASCGGSTTSSLDTAARSSSSFLPATDYEGALRIAEEARARVSALGIPHERSDVARVVTLSVGVACSDPATLLAPEDLLRQADAALYAAKRAGRNCVMRYA